jgi:asparagine N-glycosylation enzyme membrane subunit Stt3
MFVLEQTIVRWSIEFVRRRAVWIGMAVLSAAAFFLRCLHLLNPDHYFIISPDSYFFHWVAQGVIAGEPPGTPWAQGLYTIHSGLAYPLVYIAKAVSFVFNSPSAEALDTVCKFLPPVLGVISMLAVYRVAARLYDRRVGLFSAFAWALTIHAIFTGAGGYLDRDGLSILLIMIGVGLFYFSQDWRFRMGRLEGGWLLAGLAILAVEGLLYYEWSFMGSFLMLAIVIAYFAIQLVLNYLEVLENEDKPWRRLVAAISGGNWKPFALIIGVNILILAVYPQAPDWISYAWELIRSGGQNEVQELQGLGLRDLLVYNFFLIPMALGIYVAWKERSRAAIFFSVWFLVLLILSLFSKRVLFHATPAACLLAGVGISFIWEWKGRGSSQGLKKLGVAVLFFLIILIAVINSASIGGGLLSPDRDWQDAMRYLREETSTDAIVMTQWSWGYWILDLGQRTPMVDNGYYGYDSNELRDVGLIYMSTDPSEAAEIMNKYGADYLIFSKLDQERARTIMRWVDPDETRQEFPNDSLIEISLRGELETNDELKMVHRSTPTGAVVILRLNQSEQP